MQKKINNFFYILNLALPEKLYCLGFGIYLGIFILLVNMYWDINRIPIYIMGMFIILILGLIGINFIQLKAIIKKYIVVIKKYGRI